ncbi:hypothetical protein [Sphingobium bisphenolivorans]|uniref:hypothetical protein n=1 Tax=Sphingobium bisphenolivorans TaxID=1335760 RepID=UPI0003A95F0E|nr:hypothetical protein [Sphingobium bisphenolivorans]
MFWTQAWKLGSSFWANNVALSEMAWAAHHVIGHRSRLIDAAMRDPMNANLAELSRMLPEKLSAFGKANAALNRAMMDVQADLLEHGSDLSSLLTKGWPPETAVLERIGKRGTDILLKMSLAGGHVIEPVHAAATANHRRLSRRKKRS